MKLVRVIKGRHRGQLAFIKSINYGIVTLIPFTDDYRPKLFKVSLNSISSLGGACK